MKRREGQKEERVEEGATGGYAKSERSITNENPGDAREEGQADGKTYCDVTAQNVDKRQKDDNNVGEESSERENEEAYNNISFKTFRNRRKNVEGSVDKRKETWRLKEPTKSFVVEVGKKDKGRC